MFKGMYQREQGEQERETDFQDRSESAASSTDLIERALFVDLHCTFM